MEFDISNGFWITTDREVLCMHDNYIILMNITIMLPRHKKNPTLYSGLIYKINDLQIFLSFYICEGGAYHDRFIIYV